MTKHSRVKTEKNRVYKVKKSEEKEKMFKKRNSLVLHVKQYKKCDIRKCIPTFSDHDEVAMYHQQTNWSQQTI